MKGSNNSKKKSPSRLSIIHIDSDLHQKLKIYCVTKKTTICEFASKVLSDSIKDK